MHVRIIPTLQCLRTKKCERTNEWEREGQKNRARKREGENTYIYHFLRVLYHRVVLAVAQSFLWLPFCPFSHLPLLSCSDLLLLLLSGYAGSWNISSAVQHEGHSPTDLPKQREREITSHCSVYSKGVAGWADIQRYLSCFQLLLYCLLFLFQAEHRKEDTCQCQSSGYKQYNTVNSLGSEDSTFPPFFRTILFTFNMTFKQ